MSCAAGPDIKEDGLVLALDAANTKSILSAVEVLVVAGGGGGGGSTAGGGGGGGVLYSSAVSITPGSAITATVGDGGAGTVRSDQGAPTNTSGGNSVFGALTAIGGGRGYSGSDTYTPRTSAVGGSGGGGGYYGGGLDPKGSGTSSAGTAGQGFAGGDGAAIGEWGGGGGGGAGGAGGAQVSDNTLRTGGPGLGFNISGTFQYYGGGGGGGAFTSGFSLGGIGGGGNGGDGIAYVPTAGATNTGGGGGGGGYYQYGPGGGAGGSGIIIVRYPGSQRATGGTITSVGGHTIHTFTTSGTFTPNFGDLSGNGNNGTLTNGPTYSSANGGSLVFDGVDDYVDCVLNSGLTGTGSWTMSAWFKINGAPSAGLYQNAIVDTDATGGSANMICTDWSGYHGGSRNQLLYASRPSTGGSYTNLLGPVLTQGIWYNATVVRNGTTDTKLYTNGSLSATYTGNIPTATQPLVRIGRWTDAANYANCNISQVQIHNRALTAQEVQQNYNALKGRFTPEYETLTYTASGNLTVTGNGTNTVNIFKTSGGNAWDNQAYSLVSFTAPCTIEFNKQAVSGDNGASYAMIGWNADPLTNASYDTIDYASYPFRTDSYVVYHNGSLVHNSGSWSTSSKFYIVYGTDGVMRHYNGSTLLYSVNYGTGNTVYVDSSFYSPNATFGGFSNIKVIRSAWNGTDYVR